MRKTMGLSLLVLTSFLAAAQDTPRFEVFGGYSYANASKNFGVDRPNLNGWNASFGVNANRWLGVVGDFSGYYGSPSISIATPVICTIPPCPRPSVSFDTKVHTFLLGPQVSFRMNHRITPFAHALFGVGHTSVHIDSTFSTVGTLSNNAFAMALGGGADINVTSRFAWRVQPDYLQTDFLHQTQKNFRISTGPVFRFGK